MDYGEVEGVGKRVSRLAMGSMVVDASRPEESFRLLDDAFEVGSNAFDTAWVYGEGLERTLGRWIADRGIRDEVVVIGKGGHHGPEGTRVNPKDITSDLHDSLERLGTDYIDLYLLHRDDPAVPVGPIVQVLNERRDDGLIRAFGGSNWSHGRIREANEYAAANGLTPFAASSPNFSLAEQVEEPWGGCLSIGGPAGQEARRWYRGTQMPVFAWSSLARGFFSGRITRENYEQIKETVDPACRRGFCHERNFDRLERAAGLGRRKGLSIPQVALAFVMNQPLNMFALVGCRSRRELEEDVAALAVELTPEEMEWLDLRRESP